MSISVLLPLNLLRLKLKKTFIYSCFYPTTIAPSKIVDTPTSALEKALDNLKLSDNNKLFETVNRIRNGLETARKYMGIVKEGVEDILSPKDWAVGLVDDITKLVTFDTNISAISQWRDVINRVNRFEKLFRMMSLQSYNRHGVQPISPAILLLLNKL